MDARNVAAPRKIVPPIRPAELCTLVAVSLPFLFLGLGHAFLDPGEGLYGTVPHEMVAGGDWVFPQFNGLPYLEKPPLYFWLSAAAMTLGVPAEWATRLWSALAGFGSVLLTWRLGTRLYGREGGMLAGIALATSAGFVQFARRASPDLLTVFCLTLAMYGFVRDLQRPDGASRFLLFYLGMALGVLAKGLIGILFPVVIAGAWLLWMGGPALRHLNPWRGAALVAIVVLPWHLAVAWRSPSHVWFYLVDNQVLRFFNTRSFLEDDVPISAVGFLVVSFLLFFPWSVFLLGRRAGARSTRWGSLPVIWAVAVVAFFALSGSRLEYYALPAFPALALLAGGVWAARRGVGPWLTLGAVGSCLVGAWALWAGATLTAPEALQGLAQLNVSYRILLDQGLPLPFPSPRPFGRLLQALGLVLIAGWALAVVCWRLARPRGAFAALVLTAGGIGILIVQLLHVIEPHHSARAVAAEITARARPEDMVVHEGPLEYSAALPLYARRRLLLLDGRRGDLDFASRLPQAEGLFLDRAQFTRLWEGERRVFLVTPRPAARSVVATLPPSGVHAVGRYGSRHLLSNRPGPAAAGSGADPPASPAPAR